MNIEWADLQFPPINLWSAPLMFDKTLDNKEDMWQNNEYGELYDVHDTRDRSDFRTNN